MHHYRVKQTSNSIIFAYITRVLSFYLPHQDLFGTGESLPMLQGRGKKKMELLYDGGSHGGNVSLQR